MPHPTRIAISANSSWNLVNFRGGLIRALDQAGYEVVALTPADDDAGRLAALGARHVPLPIDAKGTAPLRDLTLFLRYTLRFLRHRPTVFLGFTIKPNVYGSLASRAVGVPVVNTVSGLGTAFIRDDWLTRVAKQLYRRSLAGSYVVFFQNDDDRDLFVEHRLVSEKQVKMLPGSGVDLLRFTPDCRDNDRGGGNFCFLLCGRLLWDKGIGEYVEAARIVRREAPDARFRLLGFLGAENRTAIDRATVDAWVAQGIIEYHQAVEDVRPQLAAADCVVLPSYREGTPRALLEAAAMAKPLISTDVPGCRAVVEHGRNGFLCPPRDAKELARRMLEMIRLPRHRREAMGAAGRRKMEEEFDERIVIARYIDVISRIV